jgi:hypothetical protein
MGRRNFKNNLSTGESPQEVKKGVAKLDRGAFRILLDRGDNLLVRRFRAVRDAKIKINARLRIGANEQTIHAGGFLARNRGRQRCLATGQHHQGAGKCQRGGLPFDSKHTVRFLKLCKHEVRHIYNANLTPSRIGLPKGIATLLTSSGATYYACRGQFMTDSFECGRTGRFLHGLTPTGKFVPFLASTAFIRNGLTITCQQIHLYRHIT